MSSVQSQCRVPVKPLTAKFRYAHSRLYSSTCTTLTPRGAQTRRIWPIKPTRISSPQYKPAIPEQPASSNAALSLFPGRLLFRRRLGIARPRYFAPQIQSGKYPSHSPVCVGHTVPFLRPLHSIPNTTYLTSTRLLFQLSQLLRTQLGSLATMSTLTMPQHLGYPPLTILSNPILDGARMLADNLAHLYNRPPPTQLP